MSSKVEKWVKFSQNPKLVHASPTVKPIIEHCVELEQQLAKTCEWKEVHGTEGEILHTTECGQEYWSEFPLADLCANYCKHCGGKLIEVSDE